MSFDGVMLTVLAVLVGLVVGFARRGRVLSMARTDLRARSLLVIGIAVPAMAEQFTREMAVPLVVGGMVALFAFALRNVRIAGMSVLAIGVLANLVPTFVNNGLPVRPEALVEAGIVEPDELDRVELRGARRLEEPTQQLRFLGDVIPLPETSQVLSFGDLIVLVGLADVTANLTRMRRRRAATTHGGDGAPDDDLEDGFDDGFDDDDLPTVEEYLTFAVRSHVDRGAPLDPRPPARHAAALEPDDLAWALEPDLEDFDLADLDLADLDLADRDPAAQRGVTVDASPPADHVVDTTGEVVAGPGTAGPFDGDDNDNDNDNDNDDDDDEMVVGAWPVPTQRWGPDVTWWTPDTPPPPVPVIDLRDPPEATDAHTAPLPGEVRDDVPGDVADDVTAHLADEPDTHPVWGLDDLDDLDDHRPAPVTDDVTDDLTAHLADDPDTSGPAMPDEWADVVPAPAPGPPLALDELTVFATAPADELLRALVGDVRKAGRGRRRRRRHIPDFEPIHLDDDALSRG